MDDERQAESDHAMACRLAGRPVPQRSILPAPQLMPAAPPPITAVDVSNSVTSSNLPATRPDPRHYSSLRYNRSGESTSSAIQTPASTRGPGLGNMTLVAPESTAAPTGPRVRGPNGQFMSSNSKRVREESNVEEPSQKRLKSGPNKFVETTAAPDTNQPFDWRGKSGLQSRDFDPKSNTRSNVPQEPPQILSSCVSCTDDFSIEMLAQMTCGDDYCAECLQKVVINALTDEAL